MEEFNKLLSEYRVKKIRDREWDENVSAEKGFRVTIYTSTGTPTMASIYENQLLLYNDASYYKVINGPIDMDWVEKHTDEIE